MSKSCVSCGMPMETIDDHIADDVSKGYCVHCTAPDGSAKSYEEVLSNLTQFLINNEGLNETQAKATAKEMMTKLPAWEDVRLS